MRSRAEITSRYAKAYVRASKEDRGRTVDQVVEMLRAATRDGRYVAELDDLPASGFSGTLADRFPAAMHGRVRGKTVTLTGVHSLTGVALDAQGAPIIYAVMADCTDESQPLVVRNAVDSIAAAIAGSG